jgi:hypothetical protein
MLDNLKLHLENFVESFRALPFERQMVRVMLVLMALSLTVAVSVSLIELISLHRTSKSVQTAGAPEESKAAPLKVEIHPIQILPSRVERVETVARQSLPGAATYAAEAIYAPEDEAMMTSNPFTVYVGVTYYSSAQLASQAVDLRAASSGGKIEPVTIGNARAQSSLAPDGYSYFIGWARGNYAIEIDGRFKTGRGENKPMIALTHTIAEQVSKMADTALGGAKQPDG